MPRFIEVIIAIILFIILLPFMFLIGFAVVLTSKGSAIHWSKRVGQNNQLFLMPKFRSMSLEAPQLATHLLKNEKSYITPVGSFIRKTSLDELPQIWSIINGDMSFVGPRPALFNQDDLISLRTNHNIHLLKPGITGWAQINGRDEISIEEKVEWEKEYQSRRTIVFDFYIILKTFQAVLTKKNVSH